MAAKAKAVDWVEVEVQYRAGVRSLKDIGTEFGISPAGILKHAKAEGWERDLAERIRLKAASKVNAAMVNGKVNAKKATEQQTIEASADAQAQVTLTGQKEAQAIAKTLTGLFAELDAVADGNLRHFLELVLDPKVDKDGEGFKAAAFKAYRSAVELASRSNVARSLVQAWSILVDKRNQLFGIDRQGSDRQSLGEWLASQT